MTLLLLMVLCLMGALALVTFPNLFQVLSITPSAGSVMVDWLISMGLACRTSELHNCRYVQLTLIHDAETIIGDNDPSDLRCLRIGQVEGLARIVGVTPPGG